MFYKHHSSFTINFTCTFYSHYNTDWIANSIIGLDPNNSVVKRLWCIVQIFYFTSVVFDITQLIA